MQQIDNSAHVVKSARLSALAQLVRLYAETRGITSTKELVDLTGYSRRAIVAAKCEAGCAPGEQPAAHEHPAAQSGEKPAAHRVRSGLLSEKRAAHQCAAGCSPEPTREHARNNTSRANIESLRDESVSSVVESESKPTAGATRGEGEGSRSARESANTQPAAADDLKDCRPTIAALARAMYPNAPYPPLAGIEKSIRAALQTGHAVGQIRSAANILIAKLVDDDEDEIRKPLVLLARILDDVRRGGAHSRPSPIPPGAINLGGGQYLSRW